MHSSLSVAVLLSIKQMAKAEREPWNEAEQDSKHWEDWMGGRGRKRLQEMFLQVYSIEVCACTNTVV